MEENSVFSEAETGPCIHLADDDKDSQAAEEGASGVYGCLTS